MTGLASSERGDIQVRAFSIVWPLLMMPALVFISPAHAGEASAGAKQSVAGGGATVVVTLLGDRSDALTFQIVLDSHSVDLDGYRFEEIVRLRDGQGGEVPPATVEGAQGGGHHREATVRFAWPGSKPQALELVVKGVAGVPERVFRWPVQ